MPLVFLFTDICEVIGACGQRCPIAGRQCYVRTVEGKRVHTHSSCIDGSFFHFFLGDELFSKLTTEDF